MGFLSIVRIVVFATLLMGLVSCASYFKRKECEKVNWFEYGQKVAQRGQNLENDNFIRECRKAEAQISNVDLDVGFKKGREIYCSPSGAFLTGKQGQQFAPTMCDGPGLKNLQAKYNDGVTEYCQVSNGPAAGASGNKYQDVCPKSMEAGFLKGYRKGRIGFLNSQVNEFNSKIELKNAEIERTDQDRRREETAAQYAELHSRRKVDKTERDPITGRLKVTSVSVEDPDMMMRAQRHRSEASMLSSRVGAMRAELKGFLEQKHAFQSEVGALLAVSP